MEQSVDTLVKTALQPLVVRIDQLEAENKELRTRLDNFQAMQGRLTKPHSFKQPVVVKPIPGKDNKKPQSEKPGVSTNGLRPSLPVEKKPKEEEPKPKAERPSTGKPGDKKPIENGPKPVNRSEIPKKDEHKKDETKHEEHKTEEHKKDDHKKDEVKKDTKPSVSPRPATKDTTKKDVKSPTQELKPHQQPKPGQKSPSTGADKNADNKAPAVTGGKTVIKQNEKLDKDGDVNAKKKDQQKHEQKAQHREEHKHEEIKQQPNLLADKAHPKVPAPHHKQPSANPQPVASHEEKVVVSDNPPHEASKEEHKNQEQTI